MNNNLLQIKIKQRLNKLASLDYDNLECWQIAEAFNKAQLEWVRRKIKTGNETSSRDITDLQILIATVPIIGTRANELYFEIPSLPDNFLDYKRVSFKGKKGDCPDRPFIVYLAEDSDVDLLLSDTLSKPSFDWAETFCTLVGGKIRIYTNNEFEVINPRLSFYRKPVEVQFMGCTDLNTGNSIAVDVKCELKEDVIEILCDEAASILAGDIEAMMQYQRNEKSAEKNN